MLLRRELRKTTAKTSVVTDPVVFVSDPDTGNIEKENPKNN